MRRICFDAAACALILAALVPASARAQTFAEAEAAAKRMEFAHYTPFAGVSAVGALSRKWTVTTFYVLWDRASQPATPRWAARRAAGGQDGQRSVSWASSDTCPALPNRLGALEAIQAPRFDVPGITPSGELQIVLDGVGYTAWTSSAKWPGGDIGGLEVSSNVGTPLARWSDATDAALAGCWSPAEPALPRR